MSANNTSEAVLFGLIQQIGPKAFQIALHNVSSHGDVFKENYSHYLDNDDKFLCEWFDGIDKLSKAVKKAKKR